MSKVVKENSKTKHDTLSYKQRYEFEKQKREKMKIKLSVRERQIHDITTSGSYKLAKKIAYAKHLIRYTRNYGRELHPKRISLKLRNKQYIHSYYDSKEFEESFRQNRTCETAVVLHLYYPDMLSYFSSKLQKLPVDYDLFVTLPDVHKGLASDIRKRLGAQVIIVPNGGRDVLPFIQVAKRLYGQGYEVVLKIHSKKSPHFKDGDVWRERIINNLMPGDRKCAKKLMETLRQPKTAIVGPRGEYVSLLVSYAETGHRIQAIVGRLMNKKLARELQTQSDEFGFFAGTMFWVRLESIMPIINNTTMDDFEPEMGQVDSTLAHALERLMCVYPELEGRNMYEMSNDCVELIEYHTANIPSWSEIYEDHSD